MKKMILISTMMALFLSFSFVLPVSAASNVTENYKDQNTEVEQFIYDEVDGRYLVTVVVHYNYHVVEYSDGQFKLNIDESLHENAFGEGVLGPYYEYSRRSSLVANYQTGKDFTVMRNDHLVIETEGSFAKYQLILHWANGIMRVDIERSENMHL